MKPSNRIENITSGGSDGWEIFYKARKMMASGINVIELSIGEHDIGTHLSILKSMHKAAINGQTGYCLLYTSDAADEGFRCRSRWSPYH